MIDIETIDTTPDSVILSVGAVKFDPFTDVEPRHDRLWRVSIDEQLSMGRTVSDSTIAWWAQQDATIREEAFSETDRISITQFTSELNRYLVGVDKIWCQGPQFDMVIIENLYAQMGIHRNWSYWQVSDCRTIFNLMPEDPRKGIRQKAHDALADAYYQAISVQKVYKHFGVKPRFERST